jgi:hypothetical protein
MSCLNKNSLQMISVANMNCYNNKRTRLINMKNNKWKRPCDYIYAVQTRNGCFVTEHQNKWTNIIPKPNGVYNFI